MSYPDFYHKLVDTIVGSISSNENRATVIADILSIGKESVYRRLRGEVSFTLDEVVKLSLSLKFSIDDLLCIESNDCVKLCLKSIEVDNFFKNYLKSLNEDMKLYSGVVNSGRSLLMQACNVLPVTFCYNYENLLRFVLFTNVHQFNTNTKSPTFFDFFIPDNVRQVQKEIDALFRRIKPSTFILDLNLFASFTRNVQYYYRLQLITDDEIKAIQEELFQMLDELEEIATIGSFSAEKENEVNIYISNVDFRTPYVYIEYDDSSLSLFLIHTLNKMNTNDARVCQLQKKWMNSLLRYSTLISRSGEIQRRSYFKIQRESVQNMILPARK